MLETILKTHMRLSTPIIDFSVSFKFPSYSIYCLFPDMFNMSTQRIHYTYIRYLNYLNVILKVFIDHFNFYANKFLKFLFGTLLRRYT